MDELRTEKSVVEEKKRQLGAALEYVDGIDSGDQLRRVVTNAQNAMVAFDPKRANLTGDLIKIGLERQVDLTAEYKLRFRAEVLLNAYKDWSNEITARESAPGR